MIEGTCPYCGHDKFWGLTKKYVRCASCEELIERTMFCKNDPPKEKSKKNTSPKRKSKKNTPPKRKSKKTPPPKYVFKYYCPECGCNEYLLDFKRVEVVCNHCGLVINESIFDDDFGLNEFKFSQIEKQKAIEDPTTFTLHDKGLPTKIDNKNKDIYGNNIPSKNRSQWHRIRKLQMKAIISGSYERNLAEALNRLNIYARILRFSKTMKEDASITYRKALNNKLVGGRSIHKIVAACLYITCRRFNTPHTLDEIGEITKTPKRELGRTYRFLSRELNIKLPLVSPIDFVPRYSSKLGFSGEIEAKAIEIIEKARKKGHIPGQPKITAVAALYISSDSFGEKILIKDITNITGVTGQSLKNRRDELIQSLD